MSHVACAVYLHVRHRASGPREGPHAHSCLRQHRLPRARLRPTMTVVGGDSLAVEGGQDEAMGIVPTEEMVSSGQDSNSESPHSAYEDAVREYGGGIGNYHKEE
jgi:hypothetical protein